MAQIYCKSELLLVWFVRKWRKIKGSSKPFFGKMKTGSANSRENVSFLRNLIEDPLWEVEFGACLISISRFGRKPKFFFFLSVSVLLLMCLFRSVLDLFEKREVKILSKFVKLG